MVAEAVEVVVVKVVVAEVEEAVVEAEEAVVFQSIPAEPFQALLMMKLRWNLGKMNSRRRNRQNQALRVVLEIPTGIGLLIHPENGGFFLCSIQAFPHISSALKST